MRPLTFALLRLARDWRHGEWFLLGLAVAVAVCAAASVGLFTERVESGILASRGQALGADLLIKTHQRPLPRALIQRARAHGLLTARIETFASVALAGEQSTLTSVKAVDKNYPLRGQLLISADTGATAKPADRVPTNGTIWVGPRLLNALDISVGDNLQLGNSRFRVTRIIRYEPDNAGSFNGFAPRVLMNRQDLAATGLIQPGSRVDYVLMLAGAPTAIRAFRTQNETGANGDFQWITPENARPALRRAISRASVFLRLAALCAVVLAAVAIALCAHQMARRRQDEVALLKALGAEQRFILQTTLLQLLLHGLVAGLLGAAAGYLGQMALTSLLAGWFSEPLPAAGPVPVISALASGLVALAGFALIPVIALRRVPPARVFQRALNTTTPSQSLRYLAVAASIGVLVLWQTDDTSLTLRVLGGGAVAVTVLASAAWILVRSLAHFRERGGNAWRFGIANLARRREHSVLQVVAFGIGMMMLITLALVRADLLGTWRTRIPKRAPNHFLVNIQPAQRQAVTDFLKARGLRGAPLYPVVQARIESINAHPVKPENYPPGDGRRMARHDFSISWTRELPTGNKVVAGHWWSPDQRGQASASVAQSLAKALHVTIGDQLGFRVGSRQVTVRVKSIRKVDWDNLHANFFVLTPPGTLNGLPTTYIAAVYVPPQLGRLTTELIRRFPAVTVIDVGALLDQLRHLINQVISAVEYVFAFTLLAGLIVLLAAIHAGREERRNEIAILRTLGADRRLILGALAAEFGCIGMLAGVLATLAAQGLTWLLASQLLHLDYYPHPALWLVGGLVGSVGVALAGLLATRSMLETAPAAALR